MTGESPDNGGKIQWQLGITTKHASFPFWLIDLADCGRLVGMQAWEDCCSLSFLITAEMYSGALNTLRGGQ